MTGDWPPCFFLSGNLTTSQRFDLHFPHNSSRNPEMPWSWKYHPHLRLPKSSDSKKSKSHPSLSNQTDLGSWVGEGYLKPRVHRDSLSWKKHFTSPSLPDHQWCRSLRWWSRCAPPLRSFHANTQHRVTILQHAIHRNPTNKQKKKTNKMCCKWQAVVDHSSFSVNNHVPKFYFQASPTPKLGGNVWKPTCRTPSLLTSCWKNGCYWVVEANIPTYSFQNVK